MSLLHRGWDATQLDLPWWFELLLMLLFMSPLLGAAALFGASLPLPGAGRRVRTRIARWWLVTTAAVATFMWVPPGIRRGEIHLVAWSVGAGLLVASFAVSCRNYRSGSSKSRSTGG